MSETYHLILISFLSSSLIILNLLFFLLAARQNVWAWVAGGLYAAASCGMTLSLSSPAAQIFSVSRIFQFIVELLLFAYGAFLWHKNGHRFFNQPAGKHFPVSSLLKQYFSVREQVVLSVIFLAAFLLLSRSTAYASFAINVFSLALIAHKKIEGWILLALTMALSALSLPDLHFVLPHILKLTVFVYGFLCWKSKLNKKEEIEAAALSSLFKTGVLSLLYIALAIAAPFVVTYFVCKGGGSGCSGIPAGFFLFGFPMVSLVIAAVILFVKKEHFRQWQLFFIANGLFGLEVLRLLEFVMKMPGMFR